ncbi:MAG: hypothetical protein IAG10_24910 [Planctomycetaceae bacterium]|nr:hypothetical protein [Planctomycetaceae bacterium]
MSKTIFAIIVVGLLWITATAYSQKPQAQPPSTLFTPLKIGQKVFLKDAPEACYILIFSVKPQGAHTVSEIGIDHIVLDGKTQWDLGYKKSKTWIPRSSIREIIVYEE